MGLTKHDRIAREIAVKKGTEYHENKGVDIRTPNQVIEVEVKAADLKTGIEQVKRSTKARYIAVPNDLVKEAKEATEGTGIGVMNEHGTIKKPAR